ncbi:Aste57867_20820 [Aphanomyces stellatus]|uniref:Aste57867_20820 protein n=1 Tax=Aphanomyces stellatus TaxID=120398 RepID=A0A485LKM3_9STRA|nr:hypothetical protein As57867_020752 [Aphanomyces stellatus]VFT97499.1 Aste57867_20820 [Aphanomyces stellatus]
MNRDEILAEIAKPGFRFRRSLTAVKLGNMQKKCIAKGLRMDPARRSGQYWSVQCLVINVPNLAMLSKSTIVARLVAKIDHIFKHDVAVEITEVVEYANGVEDFFQTAETLKIVLLNSGETLLAVGQTVFHDDDKTIVGIKCHGSLYLALDHVLHRTND